MGDAAPAPQPARAVTGLGRLLLRQPRPLAVLLPLLWGWLIWSLSSGALPLDGGGLVGMWFLSNLAHAFFFGVLALLCLPLAPRRADGWAELGERFVMGVLLVCVLWGLVDESHQSFVPGRDASVWDLGTDLVGIVCTLRVARRAGPGADARALTVELLRGLAACAVAAGLSTAWGMHAQTSWWPFG